MKRYKIILLLFFTLYHACSRVDSESLPTFRWILKALRIEWRDSTLRFDSTPERRNKNIKYFISSIGNRTYNLFYSHTLVFLYHEKMYNRARYYVNSYIPTYPNIPSMYKNRSPIVFDLTKFGTLIKPPFCCTTNERRRQKLIITKYFESPNTFIDAVMGSLNWLLINLLLHWYEVEIIYIDGSCHIKTRLT